jgi:gamma-glutamyltranspeptidase/glutathione hydrolase
MIPQPPIAFRVVLWLGWILFPPAVHLAPAVESVYVDRGDAGMVVSDSVVASRIGRDVLAQGGSAVDAAVATAFALAVCWPDAGNIGGGGFMLVRPADGSDPVCIDYRETAPLAMAADSFRKGDSTFAHKAVAVPGTVRGLELAHARYGKLPWKDVVLPAASLAANGVPVDPQLAKSLNAILFDEEVKSNPKYFELRRVYGKPDNLAWEDGDRLLLPDLAETLTQIAEQGADTFYSGRIAELIVQEMQRGDGVITLEDLRLYSAKVRPAMVGTYRGYTILGAPPPSSGGTCLIQALNILEHFDLPSRDRFDPVNLHLIAETCRRVFVDRARHLGDPDFIKIRDQLTSKEYAKTLAEGIDVEHATRSDTIAPEIMLTRESPDTESPDTESPDTESPDTTHFSVVDGNGMAVSNTYTLEATWGSRIVVRRAGFVLNNEMGDFNWFPGQTTTEGQIGTAANTIAPGKRMLSSQAPTIVERDGRLLLVTGSPGGKSIISTVLGIVLGVIDFDMDPVDAVAAPRVHHQWLPDLVELENIADARQFRASKALLAMGHQVGSREAQGSAHSIAVDPRTGLQTGIADFRRGGRPAALSSGTLALWDFGDPEGTQLSVAQQLGDLRWSSDIAGSITDGRDHFRIRRDSPLQPMQAYLDLSRFQLTRAAVEVTITAAHFAGLMPNEQLRLTFTHETVIPRVTARMVFGRSEKNQIILRGESATGGTAIPPVVIADGVVLERPIVVRLELDTEADRYWISSREPSELKFTLQGTGNLPAERDANHLGFNALNDFAAEGEFLEIDRIEVISLE